MPDVISLEHERLRRAGPCVIRPDAFRKAAGPPRLSEPCVHEAPVILACVALPACRASNDDVSGEASASAVPDETPPPLKDALTKPRRHAPRIRLTRQTTRMTLASWHGALQAMQAATARWAYRSRAAALHGMGRLWSRPGQVDKLAGLIEQAKHRTLSNRLNSLSVLGAREQDAVQTASGAARQTYQAGFDLLRQGEITLPPTFIVSGWACRVRTLPGGQRQIIGFLLPGDGIGLRSCGEPLSVTTITALTTLQTVDGASLVNTAAYPSPFAGVSHAIGRASGQDEEFLVNQIFRLASPSPVVRLAHLLLELQWRLAQAGLATEREFALPLTHDTLSQALGVTVPVAAKAMRRLHRKRIIRFRHGRAILSRPDVLRQMSGFSAPASCACGLTMSPA